MKQKQANKNERPGHGNFTFQRIKLGSDKGYPYFENVMEFSVPAITETEHEKKSGNDHLTCTSFSVFSQILHDFHFTLL